jgi:hypothetical protein
MTISHTGQVTFSFTPSYRFAVGSQYLVTQAELFRETPMGPVSLGTGVGNGTAAINIKALLTANQNGQQRFFALGNDYLGRKFRSDTRTLNVNIQLCTAGAFADRVTELNIPLSIGAGPPNGTGNEAPPVQAVALANNITAIAYPAPDGSVRLIRVDQNGTQVASEIRINAPYSRALTVSPRGFALLLQRPNPNGAEAWVTEVSPTGTVYFDTYLMGGETAGSSAFIMASPRLVWNGTQFVTYFGRSGGGHQFDSVFYVNADGTPSPLAGLSTTLWRLDGFQRCSHSLSQRLSFNGTVTALACIADTYPAPGIFFAGSSRLGQVEATTNGQLGSLVPTTGAFWLSYTLGNTYYVRLISQDYNQYVGTNVHGTLGPANTIVADSVAVYWPMLAHYRGALLATWYHYLNGIEYEMWFQPLDNQGHAVVAPEKLVGLKKGVTGDWLEYASGDLGAVSPYSNGVRLLRISNCP